MIAPRKKLRRRGLIGGVVIVVSLVVYGCRNEVELGDVQGTVTMDGNPLPDATVRFIPQGGGRSALGRTDENGNYTMLYSATATGALVGPVRVEITLAEEVTDAAGNSTMKPETIPARYNTASELTVDVGSGNNDFDFDLTSG